MNELDKENMQALRRIRNSGRVIVFATKKIAEQQKIRREAKDEFRELLLCYPQAREVYYNQ